MVQETVAYVRLPLRFTASLTLCFRNGEGTGEEVISLLADAPETEQEVSSQAVGAMEMEEAASSRPVDAGEMQERASSPAADDRIRFMMNIKEISPKEGYYPQLH